MAEGAFDATGGPAGSGESLATLRAVEAETEDVEREDVETDDVEALNRLGELLRDRFDEPARAADLFVDAIEAGRDAPERTVDPTINLGDFLLEERDDPVAARWWYERALRIDPTSARAHRGLAATLLAAGEPTAAEAHRCRARAIEKGVAPGSRVTPESVSLPTS